MRSLVVEARRATNLSEQIRLLQEIVAYVMQTGPKGGKFYYTPKGKKVYRKLGGKSGRSRKLAQLHGRSYHEAWGSLRPPQVHPDGAKVARALKRIFGDRAPDPKMLGDMYSAEGIESVPKRISVDEDGIVTVSYDVKESNGTKIGYMERWFYRNAEGEVEAHHDHLALEEKWQGGGRAGAMLGKALKAYKQMGIDRVSVFAALEAGPYVWARFGFESDDESFHGRKVAMRKFLTRQVGLDEAQARKLLDKVKDMHGLAGLRIQRQDADGKMETLKVGKDFLLHGSGLGEARSWHGEFDMSDPKAVSRWRRQAAKGLATRREARKVGRDTVSLDSDEVLALRNEREARIRQFRRSYERANASPGSGGSIRGSMRRFGTGRGA